MILLKTKSLPAGRQGFTLIELLLVIAILGILTVMGLASFTSSLRKGRDSKRKSDVRQIGLALESYFADKGKYPLQAGDGSGKIVGCHTPVVTCNWGGVFTDDVSIYMSQLPQDTLSAQQYYYVSTDGTYFQLYTRLENTMDSDIKFYSGPKCVGTDSTSCNYGVASTNKNP